LGLMPSLEEYRQDLGIKVRVNRQVIVGGWERLWSVLQQREDVIPKRGGIIKRCSCSCWLGIDLEGIDLRGLCMLVPLLGAIQGGETLAIQGGETLCQHAWGLQLTQERGRQGVDCTALRWCLRLCRCGSKSKSLQHLRHRSNLGGDATQWWQHLEV